MESDSIEPLCPAKYSDEQAIQFGRGSQQESTLNGAIRDLDEAASRGDETKSASHIHERRNAVPTSVKKKGWHLEESRGDKGASARIGRGVLAPYADAGAGTCPTDRYSARTFTSS